MFNSSIARAGLSRRISDDPAKQVLFIDMIQRLQAFAKGGPVKTIVLMAFLFILSPAALLAAEPLTDADRAKLIAHLEKTSSAFLASVDGLTEAQWNYRAAEGRWTIAEVAEHIAASETMIRDMATAAMKEPASAEMLIDARKDDVILTSIPDREKKFKAPEALQPTNRFQSPGAAVQAFKTDRAESLALARSGGDLRAYATKGPIGNLDAYGYLLFVSAHSERHTKQIDEVKADAGFPRE